MGRSGKKTSNHSNHAGRWLWAEPGSTESDFPEENLKPGQGGGVEKLHRRCDGQNRMTLESLEQSES